MRACVVQETAFVALSAFAWPTTSKRINITRHVPRPSSTACFNSGAVERRVHGPPGFCAPDAPLQLKTRRRRQYPRRQALLVQRPAPRLPALKRNGQKHIIPEPILHHHGPRAVGIHDGRALDLGAVAVVVVSRCGKHSRVAQQVPAELAHEEVVGRLGVGARRRVDRHNPSARAAPAGQVRPIGWAGGAAESPCEGACGHVL